MIDIFAASIKFKKKWLASQMPSVRERNHSWRGGTTMSIEIITAKKP